MCFKRKDGRPVETIGDFNAIFPYLMKKRTDSVVYFERIIDVENLLNYTREQKQKGNKVSSFNVIMTAIIKTLQERPQANRFVMGRRLYEHNDIEVSFVTKRDFRDNATETTVKLKFEKDDDPQTIIKKMSGEISNVKTQTTDDSDTDNLIKLFLKLPRFLLRFVVWVLEKMDFYFGIPKFIYDFDPLHCSLFVSHQGSINLESVYHHLYEWGNCSLFLMIGKVKDVPCVERNGQITIKKMLDVKVTVDERISDGYYMARTIDHFEKYILNPEKIGIKFD